VAPGSFAVVVVRALSGKAAVARLGEGTSRSWAMDSQQAVAIVPSGSTPKVALWDPSEEGPAVSEFLVSLKVLRVPSEVQNLDGGVHQENLAPGMVREWRLPEGAKQLDLVMEDGLVACLRDGDRMLGVAFAEGETTHAAFASRASRLTMCNLSKAPAGCEVDLRRGAGLAQPAILAVGSPFEHVFARGGELQFEVSPERASRILSACGAEVSCEFLDGEGRSHEGLQHKLHGPGLITLRHGPGLVKVWLSQADRVLDGRWGAPLQGAPRSLESNSLRALDGGLFELNLDRPSAVRLRMEGPAVLALERADHSLVSVEEGASETVLEACLEPGRYGVRVRGLMGNVARGSLECAVSDVGLIEKTLGAETLIHGAESKTFRFQVKQPARFGIGLKADRDALSCQLLKAGGELIGTGSQQYVDLAAGTYLLRVSLRPGEEPAKFTPVVVGLEASGNGPPEEVLRAFLAGLGLDQP